MNTCFRLIFVLVFVSSSNAGEWRSLFTGDNLNGWDTYVGPSWSPSEKDFAGEAPGLNNDPDQVFSVVLEDGVPAMRISGESFGGISTVDEFENYHFSVQFKWGEARYAPRADANRDSGILYHAVGPHAADWFFWMRSQEFQVQEGDCGDYWGLVGANVNIASRQLSNEQFIYDPAGELRNFHVDSENGRHCVKFPDGEFPSGEWNTLDLYCFGGTSVHVVNGVVTMVLRDSRQPNASGNGWIPLEKGKLQIQSEGAEVFYRKLKIRSIEALPFGVK